MQRLFVLALALIPAVALGAGPEDFQWSSPAVDFQNVPVGAELAEELRLTNRGDKVWRIAGTTTTCGCATASHRQSGRLQASAETLKPGETVTIVVTARPKRLGPSNGALFLKLEEVGKNASGLRESVGIDVRIRGTRRYDILDDEVDVGKVMLGAAFARSIPIRSSGGDSFRIENIRTSGGPLQCDPDGNQMLITNQTFDLKLHPEAKPGSFSQTIVVDLRVGEQTEQAVITCSGSIATDFQWTPDPVVLIPEVETEIAIKSGTNAPFAIERCHLQPAELNVDVTTSGGLGHKVQVRWKPQAGGAPRTGELILRISGHPEARLSIPIQCLRPEPDREDQR